MSALMALWMGLAAAEMPPVEAVGHRGVIAVDVMEWRTVVVSNGHGLGTVELLLPLHPDTRLVEGQDEGVLLHRDDQGQVEAIEFTQLGTRRTFALRSPVVGSRIEPPLLRSDAVQRVEVEGGSFTPDAALGMEKHIGHHTQPDIDGRQRRQIDSLLVGRRSRLNEQPMYLVAGPRLVRAGGMIGSTREAGSRSTAMTLAVGALFALIVGVLGLVYRLLDRMARSEQVDAYIRQNFEEKGHNTS